MDIALTERDGTDGTCGASVVIDGMLLCDRFDCFDGLFECAAPPASPCEGEISADSPDIVGRDTVTVCGVSYGGLTPSSWAICGGSVVEFLSNGMIGCCSDVPGVDVGGTS